MFREGGVQAAMNAQRMVLVALVVTLVVVFFLGTGFLGGRDAAAQEESPFLTRPFCTERISVDQDGRASIGQDQAPTMSADGRYVVFGTTAALETADTNGNMDLYLRDRLEGVTRRVTWSEPRSRDAGVGAGDAFLSADGAVLVYATRVNRAEPGGPLVCSTALTAPARECIVRRRLDGGPLTVLDVDPDGVRGDRHSRWPALSWDGGVIAYWSTSNALDGRDFNDRSDVYRHLADGSRPQRISHVRGAPTGSGDSGAIGRIGADAVSISRNGRWTVFASTRPDLVPGDTNGVADLFVHDSLTNVLSIVSRDADDGPADNLSPSGARQALSDDGRYVVFSSFATDLVSGDTNGAADVFVRDRERGRTERVSVADDGGQAPGASGPMAALSPDGRYAYFASSARLSADDTDDDVDVYVRDRLAERTIRLSVTSAGESAAGHAAARTFEGIAVSGGGLHVAFASSAAELVPGGDGSADIYLRGPCDGVDPDPLGQPQPTASATSGDLLPTRSPTVDLTADPEAGLRANRLFLPWVIR